MEKNISIQYNILCEIIFNREIFEHFLAVKYPFSDDHSAYIIQQYQNILLLHFNQRFKALYQNNEIFFSKLQDRLQGSFEVPFPHLSGTSDKSAFGPSNINQ